MHKICNKNSVHLSSNSHMDGKIITDDFCFISRWIHFARVILIRTNKYAGNQMSTDGTIDLEYFGRDPTAISEFVRLGTQRNKLDTIYSYRLDSLLSPAVLSTRRNNTTILLAKWNTYLILHNYKNKSNVYTVKMKWDYKMF